MSTIPFECVRPAAPARFPSMLPSAVAGLIASLLLMVPGSPAGVRQEAFVKASVTDRGDMFGRSIDISGNTMIVGAPCKDGSFSTSGPLKANEYDDSLSDAGAAYVFIRGEDGQWQQQVYLKPAQNSVNARFGGAVSISGDLAAVGAPGGFGAAGIVYVFARHDGVWTQEAMLFAPIAAFGDQFGTSVALSGNVLIAGSPYEGSSPTYSGSAPRSGAAFLFERQPDERWVSRATLRAANRRQGDLFGSAVAIDGDLAVVGRRAKRDGAPAQTPICRTIPAAMWEPSTCSGTPARHGCSRRI